MILKITKDSINGAENIGTELRIRLQLVKKYGAKKNTLIFEYSYQMMISGIQKGLVYFRRYFPLRINFCVVLLSMLAIYAIIHVGQTETSSFAGLLKLIAKVVLYFACSFILLAFFSVLLTWLHFKFGQRNNSSNQILVDILPYQSKRDALLLKISIPQIIKPILGYIKLSLQFEKKMYSEKFSLNNMMRHAFLPWGKGICGEQLLHLPDIKAYHFLMATIFFEDMFQLFSFSVSMPLDKIFYNYPKALEGDETSISTSQADEEKIRIEDIKKVEGEYLNYKKFESNDDVRRIVWKIYAKNKELVVRKPETIDPYASQILFYASFYIDQGIGFHAAFLQAMLNRYKTYVWSLYHQLEQGEFALQFMSDQFGKYSTNIDIPVLNQITQSQWQDQYSLTEFVEPSTSCILCIHSLSSIEEVSQLLNQINTATTICFVRLSSTLKSNFKNHPILNLFRKPPPDSLSQLKQQWLLHPFKFNLIRHEKQLLALVHQCANPIYILS